MALQVERRLFTVDEYDCLIDAGFFGPDERLELIDGMIVRMHPIGARHAACVARFWSSSVGAWASERWCGSGTPS